MSAQRVALVLILDVEGDPPDAINWAEHALRFRLGGARLGLPVDLPLAPGFVDRDISVAAIDIVSPRQAIQSGALTIEVAPPR